MTVLTGGKPLTLDGLPNRIEPEPNSGCWLWAGSVCSNGYGYVTAYRRAWKAHRYIWTLVHGSIPDGMLICHRCDTPLCVNPDHLFLGTARDNMRDMIKKGRDVPPDVTALHQARTASRKARTHCAKGHPYDPQTFGRRARCHVCAKLRRLRYEARQRRGAP